MKFATFLKKKRDQAGLRQSELATKMGYTTSQYVSNQERGISYPARRTLKKLCRVLNIDPVEMKKMFMKKYSDELDKDLGL